MILDIAQELNDTSKAFAPSHIALIYPTVDEVYMRHKFYLSIRSMACVTVVQKIVLQIKSLQIQ